ncbi:MAG: hypothetical protein PHH28_09915, partial [Desulfuromonadaceae bacterium]|nr:hypothetical protein [Desulfuromonadaceae bacterium]
MKYQRNIFFVPVISLAVFAVAACSPSQNTETSATSQNKTEQRVAQAAFAATTTATRKAAAFAAQTSVDRKKVPEIKYNAGENPEYARQ